MGIAQDLVNAGYYGYQGWGDAEAQADYNATGGAGKYGGGGGGGGSGGGVPSFNFDYVAEAEKAYGELGAYYTRILSEAQGDTTKALARLTQDYETGLRFRREDVAFQQKGLDTRSQQADRSAVNNALARGIFQKSAYDPSGGMGIADTMRTEAQQPINRAREQLLTGQQRYEEQSLLNKTRRTEDLQEAQRRREFQLEQERRRQAGELANQRGQMAYQKFSSGLY